MVAGERREGARWFAGQIGDNAGDRLRRAARALVRRDREQAVDQPRWLAGSRQTRARLVEGLVDEAQWPANRLGKDVRRLPVREGLTPRDDVLRLGMPWLGQGDGGDRGDVAGVDERDPAVARRGVDYTVVDDVVSLAQEVLHEVVRPEHRPRQTGLLQALFHLMMHPADRGIRMRRRAECGKLHDMSNARSEEHTSELQSHLNLVCRL